MRKMILVGRSEAGKTSLTQALKGQPVVYRKTQYVNHWDVIIDTPGEYAQTARLGGALAIFSFEADVIGLLCSATEPYTLFNPAIAGLCTREVIGIITKTDRKSANVKMARLWLEEAGCKKIFPVSSYTGEGIAELLSYLKEDRDVLPWEQVKEWQQKYGGVAHGTA